MNAAHRWNFPLTARSRGGLEGHGARAVSPGLRASQTRPKREQAIRAKRQATTPAVVFWTAWAKTHAEPVPAHPERGRGWSQDIPAAHQPFWSPRGQALSPCCPPRGDDVQPAGCPEDNRAWRPPYDPRSTPAPATHPNPLVPKGHPRIAKCFSIGIAVDKDQTRPEGTPETPLTSTPPE